MKYQYNPRQNVSDKDDYIKNRLVKLLLIIFFILFVISLPQTVLKVRKIDKEYKNREDQLRDLEEEQKILEARLREITSDEYIDKQLRDQLNLSKNNEIVLVLPEDSILERLVTDTSVQEKTDSTKPNWKKWMEVFGIKI